MLVRISRHVWFFSSFSLQSFQGRQCLLEIRSMPQWHSIRTLLQLCGTLGPSRWCGSAKSTRSGGGRFLLTKRVDLRGLGRGAMEAHDAIVWLEGGWKSRLHVRSPARRRVRVASSTAVPASCVVKWDTCCTSSGTINPHSLQVFDLWWFPTEQLNSRCRLPTWTDAGHNRFRRRDRYPRRNRITLWVTKIIHFRKGSEPGTEKENEKHKTETWAILTYVVDTCDGVLVGTPPPASSCRCSSDVNHPLWKASRQRCTTPRSSLRREVLLTTRFKCFTSLSLFPLTPFLH